MKIAASIIAAAAAVSSQALPYVPYMPSAVTVAPAAVAPAVAAAAAPVVAPRAYAYSPVVAAPAHHNAYEEFRHSVHLQRDFGRHTSNAVYGSYGSYDAHARSLPSLEHAYTTINAMANRDRAAYRETLQQEWNTSPLGYYPYNGLFEAQSYQALADQAEDKLAYAMRTGAGWEDIRDLNLGYDKARNKANYYQYNAYADLDLHNEIMGQPTLFGDHAHSTLHDMASLSWMNAQEAGLASAEIGLRAAMMGTDREALIHAERHYENARLRDMHASVGAYDALFDLNLDFLGEQNGIMAWNYPLVQAQGLVVDNAYDAMMKAEMELRSTPSMGHWIEAEVANLEYEASRFNQMAHIGNMMMDPQLALMSTLMEYLALDDMDELQYEYMFEEYYYGY